MTTNTCTLIKKTTHTHTHYCTPTTELSTNYSLAKADQITPTRDTKILTQPVLHSVALGIKLNFQK